VTVLTCPSCNGVYGHDHDHTHMPYKGTVDPRFANCPACRGDGAVTCETCEGMGRIDSETGTPAREAVAAIAASRNWGEQPRKPRKK
jgi:DnaJ-class molecular chaperone